MPGLERSTSVGLGAGGEQSFLKEPVLSEVTSTRRRVKDCCCTAGAVGLAHGLALLSHSASANQKRAECGRRRRAASPLSLSVSKGSALQPGPEQAPI